MKKIKFKRLNTLKFARDHGYIYQSVDLLRQTSVKYLVDLYSSYGYDKEQVIKIILNNTKYLLNSMIIEKD